MTTLATVLSTSAAITTTTAPALGSLNTYNASGTSGTTAGLSITLPLLSGLNVGATTIVEKNATDLTPYPITFTGNTSDTFDDLSTALVLNQPGEKVTLQVIQPSGTKYWKVIQAARPKTGLAVGPLSGTTPFLPTQFSLANTTTATTITTYTVPAGTLMAGSAFRVTLNGSIATTSTASQTLTFTPFIQGTSVTQAAVLTTSATNAASPFWLEFTILVRTTGATGTAVAKPFGIANMATSGVQYLASGSALTATTINTTSAASSSALYVQAAWSSANAANILLVETATVERVF